jgi:hypothetical protein
MTTTIIITRVVILGKSRRNIIRKRQLGQDDTVATSEYKTIVKNSPSNIPVTNTPSSLIPSYASDCGISQYSSACSCIGVVPVRITAYDVSDFTFQLSKYLP